MILDTLATTLVSVHPLTPSMSQFVLEAPGHTFQHRPGHHVGVAYENDEDGLVHRSYSPVNGPGTPRLVLAVKEYDDGTCSRYLHARSVGDTIHLTDPSGNLHLNDPARDVLFVSTGTGITPMLAMLKAYLDDGQGRATFVVGERSQSSLPYRETLDQLAAEHAGLDVHYVLSREDWHGRTGYVQDHLDDVLDGRTDVHAYVCGVPGMVVDTQATLQEQGVPEDHIFTEGWEAGAVDDE
jgi:ferredoxin-NADP reductase